MPVLLRKYAKLVPALLVMILIFVHSSMTAELSRAESSWIVEAVARLFPSAASAGSLSFLVRKTAHFLEYLALGLCLRWGLERSLPSFCAGCLYAVTDEIHQLFVPGRSCEARDMCIDAAGVLTGVLLMRALLKWRGQKRNQ